MCEDSLASRPNNEHRRARFVTAETGREAQTKSIEYANGDVDKVARACADGIVDALVQSFDNEEYSMVFTVCGPGFNGIVGMHTALALKERGYTPTVFWLSGLGSQVETNAPTMLSESDIPVCDFIPSTLDFYFDLVVDALLGMGFDGEDIRPDIWPPYGMMLSTEMPIISVDVPSGWDLEAGPRSIDVEADTFVKPDVLVSLGVPKNCSKVFAGEYHFIGGQHLPPGWLEAKDLDVPVYPGKDANCVLFSGNPTATKPRNGERYGRPDQFQATLYTKRPRRKWISDEQYENDFELWDEFD